MGRKYKNITRVLSFLGDKSGDFLEVYGGSSILYDGG